MHKTYLIFVLGCSSSLSQVILNIPQISLNILDFFFFGYFIFVLLGLFLFLDYFH